MTKYQFHLLLQELLDMTMGSTLAKCALTDLGIQWAGWAIAAAFKTEKFYDLAGNNNVISDVIMLFGGHVDLFCRLFERVHSMEVL